MLIKNGYLFTTCTNDFEKLDIRIENTKITEVDFNISPKENEEVIAQVRARVNKTMEKYPIFAY